MRWSTGDIWATAFATYFVLSVLIGLIQRYRGKEIWETRLFGALGVMHSLWMAPIALPLMALYWILKWGLVALAMPILFAVWVVGRRRRRPDQAPP